jgi:hypothetical protein
VSAIEKRWRRKKKKKRKKEKREALDFSGFLFFFARVFGFFRFLIVFGSWGFALLPPKSPWNAAIPGAY